MLKSARISDAQSELVKELREQFPVSNGEEHLSVDEKLTKIPLEKDREFNSYEVPRLPQIDVNIIVKERLDAVVRLNANPSDLKAREIIRKCDEKMAQWILTKEIPGQFGFDQYTGDAYATPLVMESNINNWLHKDYLKKLAPLSHGCIGRVMLEKMGWKEGEGLGKRKAGISNPVATSIKVDRKGLKTDEENERITEEGILIDGKRFRAHPVTVLIEYCKRKRWPPPEFECISEGGPDHYKTFLTKVTVNKIDYKPSIASLNKKLAKARAAHAALETLGIKKY